MSFTAEQTYNLLPEVHRTRDHEQGPLRQLIEVIAGQTAVLEENLDELYENQFAETAASWAIPYLADLLGIRGLSGRTALTRTPRSEVGHTIAYRRRKGTAAMLEQLARDLTGWPARAVEFFERLAATQHVNHVRPKNQAWGSLRIADRLEFISTPFEHVTRTAEVRRIEPRRGKWNIPNVGLFVWRLRAYSLTRSPLFPAHLPGDRHFRFHPIGLDLPLYNRPQTEDEFTHLAEPINVPIPITRRMLKGAPYALDSNQFHPSPLFYGRFQSLVVEQPQPAGEFSEIEPEKILVADLSDVTDAVGNVIAWAHENAGIAQGLVLVDPMLGRVVFPAAQDPAAPPVAKFHYGFSANVGGGEYDRSTAGSRADLSTVQVSNQDPLQQQTISGALAIVGPRSGIIEITDSSRYLETALPLIDATGRQIEIRATDQRRPTVILDQDLEITGDAGGIVTLDGLLVTGHAITVTGQLGILRIRHCTLVPLIVVRADGTAALDDTPALTVNAPNCRLEIEHSIVRPLRVAPDVRVELRNSIVDSGDKTGVALAGLNNTSPSGSWRIENCTVIGKAAFSTLELASNTLFVADLKETDPSNVWPAPILTERRQTGCVRFSWLPAASRVPRRFQCLPSEGGPALRPDFTSLQFGDAAYAQLGRACPEPIRRGADDESEMGVFHDLFQPQREAHLKFRLEEYLRFGLEIGILNAT